MPNGNGDLYLELDLLAESKGTNQYTLTWGTGYWQRWGYWNIDSYMSIGWYSDPPGSPSISTIQNNLSNNSSYYDNYWTRLNFVDSYGFHTSRAGSEDSDWYRYYKEAVRCSTTFDRWNTNRRVILAGYSEYDDQVVVAEYIIPAIDIRPDTFVAQSQWDIVYCPTGGGYSGATQTKIKDTNLILNSEIPIRKGFTFNEWNTALDGSGTSYSPGDSYTQNEPLMLFAQWTKNISLDSLKYVSWPRFKNFITSIKSRLKPDNLSAYVIKEGIFKTIRENATTTGTNVDWWWQYRHWSDGIAEAWGCGLGQSSTSNTITSLYTALPKDIFVDHPITTMSVQLNGIYGVWPTHVNAHTYTSSETSDPDAVGITWIDNYINHDMDNQGKGKNYWVRYYLRGRWAYKATITNDTSITDNGTYNYVKYNNTKYFTPGASFIFKPGETLTLRSLSIGTGNAGSLYVDGTQISSDTEEQTWTLPFKDISIKITITGNVGSRIDITTL